MCQAGGRRQTGLGHPFRNVAPKPPLSKKQLRHIPCPTLSSSCLFILYQTKGGLLCSVLRDAPCLFGSPFASLFLPDSSLTGERAEGKRRLLALHKSWVWFEPLHHVWVFICHQGSLLARKATLRCQSHKALLLHTTHPSSIPSILCNPLKLSPGVIPEQRQ